MKNLVNLGRICNAAVTVEQSSGGCDLQLFLSPQFGRELGDACDLNRLRVTGDVVSCDAENRTAYVLSRVCAEICKEGCDSLRRRCLLIGELGQTCHCLLSVRLYKVGCLKVD